MIVTLTPNPSIDRTITLSETLVRGQVIRSTAGHDDPGGKGVNVAQVVRNAGQLAVAVLPGDHDDPLLVRLRELRLTHRAVPTGLPSRVNLTLAEPDGVTTKINAPGPSLDQAHLDQLVHEVAREGVGARWAVLSGSLPSGVDLGWYADVVAALADDGLSIALDTSGEPLRLAVERVPGKLDLLKPNTEELADLVDADPSSLDEVEAIVEAATAAARCRCRRRAADSRQPGCRAAHHGRHVDRRRSAGPGTQHRRSRRLRARGLPARRPRRSRPRQAADPRGRLRKRGRVAAGLDDALPR